MRHQKDRELANYFLGVAYRKTGNTGQSKVFLRRAADMGTSDNLGAYYTQIAQVSEQTIDYKNAIRFYRKAYDETGNKDLLYQLARSYDLYYRDKKVALRSYQRYLAQTDSSEPQCMRYSRQRISDIKGIMHFKGDTVRN